MKRHHVEGGIPTIEVALSEYMNSDDLKKLAALTKEKLPTRKADLAAVIMRHLDGERLRTVWQCLDELQRAAVAEVVHSSSTQFFADRFHAKYGRDPNWGTTDKYGHHRSPSALGFFFYGNGVMPADLKARLKAFVPPPVEAKIKTLAALPAAYDLPYTRWNSKTKTQEKGTEVVPLTVRETERTAQRELLSVLRLVDAGKVAVSDKTRRASSATIEAITNVLEGGDYYPRLPAKDKWHDENAGPIRAFAWPLLLQAGGLAQLSGSKLQLTKAGRKALAEPAAETIRTIWTKWLDTTILDELSRIDCVKGQTGKGKHGLTAVSSRRDAVADALAECPVGGWILTDEFFRFLRASGNDFSVTRNAWNLYIGELQYGSLGYDDGERILEERYLYCLLLEYAATLGLIDVALIPPARRSRRLPRHVGHGRAGVLQPLRRADVLPRHAARCLLPRRRIGIPARARRGETRAARAAQSGNRGHRRGAGAGRSARPRRLRDQGLGPRLAAGRRQAPCRDRRGPTGGRDPRVPGGAKRRPDPRHGRPLARGCRRAKREGP